MRKRMTTDNPQGNLETMLNYAYAKDKRVILRYGDGERNIDLCDYISRKAKQYCCGYAPTPEEVMDGACMELECDCVLSEFYAVATQAAELRERLKEYEDAEEMRQDRKEQGENTEMTIDSEVKVKSEWKVQCNYISGLGLRYIAYRIRNINEPVHSGNIEHYGEYSESEEEIQKLVDVLNAREVTAT